VASDELVGGGLFLQKVGRSQCQ